MNWTILQSEQQLNALIAQSKSAPVLIFKHSIRCPISSMAKNRLEMKWDIPEKEVAIYYLDIINHRNLSNQIAEVFQVQHESPQALLIENGLCTFTSSHLDISMERIKGRLAVG